jgi:hypothetical protein
VRNAEKNIKAYYAPRKENEDVWQQARKMVLPPGYEDAMLCRTGDRPVYDNPSALLGAASSFWKCERADHATYRGVWLGSKVATPADVTSDRYECVRGDCRLFDQPTASSPTGSLSDAPSAEPPAGLPSDASLAATGWCNIL